MSALGLFVGLQIWVLAVGVAAYVLDRHRHLSPGSWLAATALALAPLAIPAISRLLSPYLTRSVTFELPSAFMDALPSALAAPAIPAPGWSAGDVAFALYGAVALGLALVTFARLAGLMHKASRGERIRTDVVLVEDAQPPLALGAPVSAVVVSRRDWQGLPPADRRRLLAHERVHLRHRDPAMRLGLALFAHALWINPGARALLEGWVQAAELRADRAAASADPHAYARLFASLSRSRHRSPLPVPTFPAQKRRAAMRVSQILTPTTPRCLAGPVIGLAAALALTGGAGLASAQTDDPVVMLPTSEIRQFRAEGVVTRDLDTAAVEAACGAQDGPTGMVVIKGWLDAGGGLSNLKTELATSDCLERLAYADAGTLDASHFDMGKAAADDTPSEVLMMFLHTDKDAKLKSIRKIKGTLELDADTLDLGDLPEGVVSEGRIVFIDAPEGVETVEDIEDIRKIIVKRIETETVEDPQP